MGDALISNLVGRVFGSLFSVAKREIRHIRNFTENVNNLKNEVQKLKDMRGMFQKRIDEAKDRGDDLFDGLQKWMDKANDEISNADKFLEQVAKAKKNMKTAYHYSKAARNKIDLILQHQKDGMVYESCVSIPVLSPGPIQLYQRKNLDDIDTQSLALEKIVRAIKDDCIQIVGIYGLGGVGKTTLAEEAALAVKNLFADVLLITVSQNVDVEKIKKKVEIAAKRIIKGEKILIILDDVWEEVRLETLCIPCGDDYMNCKILLTSRSIDVCMAMNAQCSIRIDSLVEKEAWILFKRAVGERVENEKD